MLIQLIKNTVDFQAYGADCEKLLKFAVNNGIEIQKPNKKAYSMCGTINAKDYKKLRTAVRKYGLKMKIVKKSGPYFYIKRNKLKIGFVSGCLFVLVIILILNMFIWEINITGNKIVPTETILSDVDKMGLKKGSLRKKHDEKMIEWQILKENKEIANVQLNIQGCCANITIREIEEPVKMKPDDDIPVNIVASKYGVIRKMNVFDGQKRVKVGDAVMKGDLLVSAVYEDRHDKLTLKHAKAEIIAETDYGITVSFPMNQTIEKRGNLKRKTAEIEVLGAKIILGKSKNNRNYVTETEEKQLCFFWIKLPVYLTTVRYFDVKYNNITYNFEQGRSGAYALLSEREKEELNGCEILSRIDTERIKNDEYIVTAEYTCLMNIAEEQPIESDVPWKNTDDIS